MVNLRPALSGSESDNKTKDLAGIFADIGRGIGKIFRPQQNRKAETKTKNTDDPPHGASTFAEIYANNEAQTVIEKNLGYFPSGSIIVREKWDVETGGEVQSVIAMVKREPGFSRETGDWEFFAFEAKDFRLKRRETKGDCAACHMLAKTDDWVFRKHLK